MRADPALLALEDGSVFQGISLGSSGSSVGEVVFNTSMTGYQEILTDPSYCKQVVTLTCPHIGNVGANRDDEESGQVFAAGLVIREVPTRPSNWRAEEGFEAYLERRSVVAIAGIDSRRLTRILREKGAQAGCIVGGEEVDADSAVAAARAFPGLEGMDLAREVSTGSAYGFSEGEWEWNSDRARFIASPAPPPQFRVIAYDYGIKRNILRQLVASGCEVTVVPAQTPAAEVLRTRAGTGSSSPMVPGTRKPAPMPSMRFECFWTGMCRFSASASAISSSRSQGEAEPER